MVHTIIGHKSKYCTLQISHCIFWLGAFWCYLNIGHLHPKLKKGLISYHHESTKWKFRTIISWACQIRNGCCFLFLCDIKEQTTFLSPDRDWKHINKHKNGRRIFFDLKVLSISDGIKCTSIDTIQYSSTFSTGSYNRSGVYRGDGK